MKKCLGTLQIIWISSNFYTLDLASIDILGSFSIIPVFTFIKAKWLFFYCTTSSTFINWLFNVWKSSLFLSHSLTHCMYVYIYIYPFIHYPSIHIFIISKHSWMFVFLMAYNLLFWCSHCLIFVQWEPPVPDFCDILTHTCHFLTLVFAFLLFNMKSSSGISSASALQPMISLVETCS